MNRIQLLDEDAAKTRRKLAPRNPRRQAPQSPSNAGAPCFFVPMHYEPNYAYPLVVWLHGPNGNQQQLNQVMPHISLRNYVGVGVSTPDTESAEATYWGDESEDSNSAAWPQEVRSICAAYSAVEDAIQEAAERFHINRCRIFVAGYDCGGTMALRLGMAAAGLFAGAASICGPVPQGNHPLSNLADARALPIMIAHGGESDAYPMDQVCDELRLFHAAGMALNLRQYPCEQELTTKMLSDLNAWMMQIVTGVQTQRTRSTPHQRLIQDN